MEFVSKYEHAPRWRVAAAVAPHCLFRPRPSSAAPTMPIKGAYTWTEKSDSLLVSVPLKGVSAKIVDIVVSASTIKVRDASIPVYPPAYLHR